MATCRTTLLSLNSASLNCSNGSRSSPLRSSNPKNFPFSRPVYTPFFRPIQCVTSYERRSIKASSVISPAERFVKSCAPSTTQTLGLDDMATWKELHARGDVLSEILGTSNLYLIGMMGCGKTTVGKILSEALGYYFFDSDTVVEQTAGTTVAEIFAKYGEGVFRDLETRAITSLSSMNRLIVATGGGAIIRPENWQCMKNGIVVWLDVPLEDLASRVVRAGVGSRPLVDSKQENEHDQCSAALSRLTSIYEKRKHLYPQADLRLSLTGIAAKYEVDSVSSVTPNMIALELINGVIGILEDRYMHDECCPLDPSWTMEEVYESFTPVNRMGTLTAVA